ncbi:MAG: LPS sulfotransferase NodH [Halioglobus sp.]|jgi:LPS sulfotransferase NodH
MNDNYDFVVLSTQRSGSSWFIDLFRSCKDTEGHQELFYKYPRESPPSSGFNEYERYCELNPEGFAGYRPFGVWRYLRNLYARPGNVGFKLQYSHYKRFPEIMVYLFFKKIKVIHLVRDNSLDLVISQELSQHTGTSHTTEEENLQKLNFELNAEQCIARIKKLENKKMFTRKLLSILFPGHLEITYERLLDGVDNFDQVIEYLHLTKKHGDFKSDLVKRQTSDKRFLVSNFKELENSLKKAGLAHLI